MPTHLPAMSVSQRILRRLGAPLAGLHYRYFFGRSSPIALWLGRWVDRWEETSRRGDVPLDRERWEQQYHSGRWACLADASETARYGALAGFLTREDGLAEVLDVGCGEGLLRRFYPALGLHFTGIDLSEAAIARARQQNLPSDRWLQADAETFAPSRPPGAIVLNECLYYLRQPTRQARRYLDLLVPGGLLLVSMFRTPRTDAIARSLARELPLEEEVEILGKRGTWRVQVFRRGTPPIAPTAR
ncbi:MAG TPA: class I SAM-dependent methyltransferase [Thermoanaerobaculia bacterium]|nr:class I SAM-dependent methyltransferase [Thermoanaerobaculia bacterium]